MFHLMTHERSLHRKLTDVHLVLCPVIIANGLRNRSTQRYRRVKKRKERKIYFENRTEIARCWAWNFVHFHFILSYCHLYRLLLPIERKFNIAKYQRRQHIFRFFFFSFVLLFRNNLHAKIYSQFMNSIRC